MKVSVPHSLFSKMGFHFAWGVVQLLGLCIWAMLIILAIVDWAGWLPRDATDSPTEFSGVKLRTDHGTGCQYLETSDGGITPRLDRTGKQVCS